VLLCYLTTCYSIESAWFQRLKASCHEVLSNFAFKFNLRRYNLVWIANPTVESWISSLRIIMLTYEVGLCRLTV
jgi:hypothetical protein